MLRPFHVAPAASAVAGTDAASMPDGITRSASVENVTTLPAPTRVPFGIAVSISLTADRRNSIVVTAGCANSLKVETLAARFSRWIPSANTTVFCNTPFCAASFKIDSA
ncbi:hypothetical protein D3C87_1879360 [compost metagenome]